MKAESKRAKKAAIAAGRWIGSPDSDTGQTFQRPKDFSPTNLQKRSSVYHLSPHPRIEEKWRTWTDRMGELVDWRLCLGLDSAERGLTRTVVTMEGETVIIPARMLQRIHRPWNVPEKAPLHIDGKFIRIATIGRDLSRDEKGGTAFLQGEYVLTRKPKITPRPVKVVDYEGRVGTVKNTDLNWPVRMRRPWGVTVRVDHWNILLDRILGPESEATIEP
jgi:hypothetical protein